MELQSNERTLDRTRPEENTVESIKEGKKFECTQDYSAFVKKGDKIEIVKKTKKDARFRMINENGIKGDIEYTLRRGGEEDFKNSFKEIKNIQELRKVLDSAEERIEKFNNQGKDNLDSIIKDVSATNEDISEITKKEAMLENAAGAAKKKFDDDIFNEAYDLYKNKEFGLEGDDRIWKIKSASKGRFNLQNIGDKTTRTISAENLVVSIKKHDIDFLQKQKSDIQNRRDISENEKKAKLSSLDKKINTNVFGLKSDLEKVGDIFGLADETDATKEENLNINEKPMENINDYGFNAEEISKEYNEKIESEMKPKTDSAEKELGKLLKGSQFEEAENVDELFTQASNIYDLFKDLNLESEKNAMIKIMDSLKTDKDRLAEAKADIDNLSSDFIKSTIHKLIIKCETAMISGPAKEVIAHEDIDRTILNFDFENIKDIGDLSSRTFEFKKIFPKNILETEYNICTDLWLFLENKGLDHLDSAKMQIDKCTNENAKIKLRDLVAKCEEMTKTAPRAESVQAQEEERKVKNLFNKASELHEKLIGLAGLHNTPEEAEKIGKEHEKIVEILNEKIKELIDTKKAEITAVVGKMDWDALKEGDIILKYNYDLKSDDIMMFREKKENEYYFTRAGSRRGGPNISFKFGSPLDKLKFIEEKIDENKGVIESVYKGKAGRQEGEVYGIKIKKPDELEKMSEEELKVENANAISKLNELKQNMDFVWIEKTPEYDQLLRYSSLLDSSYKEKIKQTPKEIIKPIILEKSDLDKLNLADAENVLQQTSDYLNYIKTHKTHEAWFSKEFNDFGLYEQKLVMRINELKTVIVDQAFQNAINAVNGESSLTPEEIQSIQRMEEEALARGFDLSDNEEYQKLKARLNTSNATSSVPSPQHILRSEELKNKYDKLQLEQDNQRSVVMDELSAMPMNDKELANRQRIGGQINNEEIKKIQKTLTLRDFRNTLTLDKLATESAKISQTENVKDRIEGHRAVDAELINMRNALLNELLAIKTENERVKLSKERRKAAGSFMGAAKNGIWDSIKNIGSVKNNEEAMALFQTGNQVTVKRSSGEMETDWTVDRIEGNHVIVSQIKDGRTVASKKVQWGELKSYNNLANAENRVIAPSGRPAVSRAPIETRNSVQNIVEDDQSTATERTAEPANTAEQESETQRTSFFDKFKFWKNKINENETENSEKLFKEINRLTNDLKTDSLINENQFDGALSNLQIILEKISKKYKLSPELKDSFKNIREIDFSEYLRQLKSTDGFDYDQIKEYIEEDKEVINELPENAKTLKDAMNNLLDKYQKLFELSLNRSQATSEADDLLEKKFPLSPSKLKREIKGLRKDERLKLKNLLTKYSDPNEITEKDITIEDFFADETNFNKNIGDPLNLKFEETKKRKLIELAAHIKKILDEVAGS